MDDRVNRYLKKRHVGRRDSPGCGGSNVIRDESTSRLRWQVILLTLLGLTVLFSFCRACVVKDFDLLLFDACSVFGACWGSLLMARLAEKRLALLVALAVLGGAVGAGLVMGAAGSAHGLFFGFAIGPHAGLPPGIVGAAFGFLVFGRYALGYGGVVGAVCGIVMALLKTYLSRRRSAESRS